MASSQKRTISRRDLARHSQFEQVSPEVGELDERAVDDGMSEDPDEMMALLADLAGATDERLRALARRLAASLFLDVARRGPAPRRGVGRMRTLPLRDGSGDIDLDASLDALAVRAVVGLDAQDLRVRDWVQPRTAWCLLVDRSGSMGGKPLATAAVAAAAVASRGPDDYSVVAFGSEHVVVKSQAAGKSADRVVTDLLSLRGHGTTDLSGALRVAAEQLARSTAGRKIAVVLSDCRQTTDGDPVAAAGPVPELVVLAPESDCDEARAFAAATGARLALVSGPSQVADALSSVL